VAASSRPAGRIPELFRFSAASSSFWPSVSAADGRAVGAVFYDPAGGLQLGADLVGPPPVLGRPRLVPLTHQGGGLGIDLAGVSLQLQPDRGRHGSYGGGRRR